MTEIKKPSWIKMNESELIEVIKKLSEKYDAPEIGLILRDQYGIPTTKIFGKKLKQYLIELGVETNIELKKSKQKIERIAKHMKKHITDKKAKHKFQKAQSQLNVLEKYASRKSK